MDLQTFGIGKTDYSFTIVTSNIIQGTEIYIKLSDGIKTTILDNESCKTLFNIYQEFMLVYSRVSFTKLFSYSVTDTDTLIDINVNRTNIQDNTEHKWEVVFTDSVTNEQTIFNINRTFLWQLGLHAVLLNNAVTHWWWKINEATARFNRCNWPRVESLKKISQIVILKYSPKSAFVHPCVLCLLPPMIQQFMKSWGGEYKITYEEEMLIKHTSDPYDTTI